MSDTTLYMRLNELVETVARLEQKVDFIMRHLDLDYVEQGQPAVPPYLAEVRTLLQAGNLIEAIKVYRSATGVGLAEAKAAVEALARGR